VIRTGDTGITFTETAGTTSHLLKSSGDELPGSNISVKMKTTKRTVYVQPHRVAKINRLSKD
jgi:hypothetical protein